MNDKTPEQIAAEIIAKGKPNGKAKPDPVARDQGATILDDVHKFLKRFIVYPSDHAHVAHVLWIAHAHLMSAWESTPRIAFLSPEPGSGKTRSGLTPTGTRSAPTRRPLSRPRFAAA